MCPTQFAFRTWKPKSLTEVESVARRQEGRLDTKCENCKLMYWFLFQPRPYLISHSPGPHHLAVDGKRAVVPAASECRRTRVDIHFDFLLKLLVYGQRLMTLPITPNETTKIAQSHLVIVCSPPPPSPPPNPYPIPRGLLRLASEHVWDWSLNVSQRRHFGVKPLKEVNDPLCDKLRKSNDKGTVEYVKDTLTLDCIRELTLAL